MAFRRSSGSPQKFSIIQTLHSVVGAGMATYFPLREGIAQVAWKFFTRQSGVALPAMSTYRRVDTRPVGLLETKRPLPSAAQSTDMKLFQSFTVISRGGWPDSDTNRISCWVPPFSVAAMRVPSGERPQFQPLGASSIFATWRREPVTVSNAEKMYSLGFACPIMQRSAGAREHWKLMRSAASSTRCEEPP